MFWEKKAFLEFTGVAQCLRDGKTPGLGIRRLGGGPPGSDLERITPALRLLCPSLHTSLWSLQ